MRGPDPGRPQGNRGCEGKQHEQSDQGAHPQQLGGYGTPHPRCAEQADDAAQHHHRRCAHGAARGDRRGRAGGHQGRQRCQEGMRGGDAPWCRQCGTGGQCGDGKPRQSAQQIPAIRPPPQHGHRAGRQEDPVATAESPRDDGVPAESHHADETQNGEGHQTQDRDSGLRRDARRHRREELLAHPGQARRQRLVVRLEGLAVFGHRENQRGAVLDSEFVERPGDIQPNAVGSAQFIRHSRFQPGLTAAPEVVVDQFDDIVEKHLQRNGCRIHLGHQVLAADNRHGAAGGECDARLRSGHHARRSVSGVNLSASAAAISNSRNRVRASTSWAVSIIPPRARCRS